MPIQPTFSGSSWNQAPLKDFEVDFDPREYLESFFDEPHGEDHFMAYSLAKLLKNVPPGGLALEFGGGPALYGVAGLAGHASEIHFCDYVRPCLKEVCDWLNQEPGAFDWRPFIALALEAEGIHPSEQALQERAAAMRSKVRLVTSCDARAPCPLEGNVSGYDLVTAHHCTDVAAVSLGEWIKVLRNVSTLVKPGGWLIVSVTTGTRIYTVGAAQYECVDLDLADMQRGFAENGYSMDTYQVESYRLDYEREYNGMIMAIARRAQAMA